MDFSPSTAVVEKARIHAALSEARRRHDEAAIRALLAEEGDLIRRSFGVAPSDSDDASSLATYGSSAVRTHAQT